MKHFPDAIRFTVDLGPSVMLPIVMTALALCFRVGFGGALRPGLMIGVGFVGIGLAISPLTKDLCPAARGMPQRFGMSISVVDIGRPGASPLPWASGVAVLAIPVAALVNILMLLTRMTRVVNVDIRNIRSFAFTGALVNLAAGSFLVRVAGKRDALAADKAPAAATAAE
jgi:PTS system galactitol-specific IIC component